MKALEKSGYLEAYVKRRFKGSLDLLGDDEAKTFTVSLTWTDKMNQSGEIFIPSEGIKKIYLKILEFEEKCFIEKLGDQIYPP